MPTCQNLRIDIQIYDNNIHVCEIWVQTPSHVYPKCIVFFTIGKILHNTSSHVSISTKKNHNTILLIHWISEIIIKTTFNNTLKDDVTSSLRMMCVECSELLLSLVNITKLNEILLLLNLSLCYLQKYITNRLSLIILVSTQISRLPYRQ